MIDKNGRKIVSDLAGMLVEFYRENGLEHNDKKYLIEIAENLLGTTTNYEQLYDE